MTKTTIRTGSKTILNTEHPIENHVEKNGRKWQVTFGVCNGTANRVEFFATKREAEIAAADPSLLYIDDSDEQAALAALEG